MAVGTEFIIDQLKYIVLTESGTTGTVSVGAKDTSITGDIIIPETVTNNGITYTVNKLYNLRSPGNGSFYNCSDVTSVYIPKTIDGSTDSYYFDIFLNASKLRSINVDPDNIMFSSENGILYDKNKTILYKYPEGKQNKTFILPITVDQIYVYAFTNCNFNNFICLDKTKILGFGNGQFNNTKLYKFDLKNKITKERISNPSSVFYNLPYLKYLCFNIDYPKSNCGANNPNLRVLDIGSNFYTSSNFNDFNGSLNIETVNVDSQYVVDHFKDFFPQITSSTSPLKYVNIGDSVTSISGSAFSSGSSLREVTLGKNINEINTRAFEYCNNLNYLNFYNISNVALNSNSIFRGTIIFKLITPQNIILNNSLSNSPFYNINANIIEFNANIETSSLGMFSWCTVIRKLKINGSIKYINTQGLAYARNLPSVIFPSSTQYIGYQAFADSTAENKLISIVFNGNCPQTGSNLFSGSNTNHVIYYYQDTIGWGDYFGGTSLSDGGRPTQKVFRGEVTVGNYTYKFVDGINGTPNVSVRAANNVKLSGVLNVPQTVTIDDVVYTVRYVVDNGFENQYNITSFDMHNQYLEIGKNAFKGCRNLTTISNTNGITDIYESAFEGCSNLTSFAIQTISTTTGANICNYYHPIPKNCFKDCKKLQSITLSSYTYEIQESAFENCTSLQSINIPNECNKIYQNAFKNCTSLQTVTYGKNLYIIHDKAFLNCRNLQSITPSSTNNLETLKDKVFYNCYALTSAPVTSIRDIGKYCFYNCKGLTSLTLPDTTDYVDDCAFGYCNNLTTFTNNTPNNAEFGNDVFVGTDITL